MGPPPGRGGEPEPAGGFVSASAVKRERERAGRRPDGGSGPPASGAGGPAGPSRPFVQPGRLARLRGLVVYVHGGAAAAAWADYLAALHLDVVGLDCEWKINYKTAKAGGPRPVALLQLSASPGPKVLRKPDSLSQVLNCAELGAKNVALWECECGVRAEKGPGLTLVVTSKQSPTRAGRASPGPRAPAAGGPASSVTVPATRSPSSSS